MKYITYIPVLIVIAIAVNFLSAAEKPAPEKAAVYVGTYTKGDSKGIYRFELDLQTGETTKPELAGEVSNPTFLTFHPNGKFLYSVGRDGNAGIICAFKINDDGKLTLLNQQSSKGRNPCHLCIDAAGKNVLTANYSSGNVTVLPVADDGSLKPASSVAQHTGSGPNPRRQKEPHAHSINLDPAGKFAFAADLGVDKIMIYRFDGIKGKLSPNRPQAAILAPGAGPRHLCFHPSGRFAYVINELLSTVTGFSYNPEDGSLKEIQTITTLPKDFTGTNTTAEVLTSPCGKFLYGSNRGHNSIVVYSIDSETGKLTAIGHMPSGGKTPRNFGIDPTGNFLLPANQDSGTVFVFRTDLKTGSLKLVGKPVKIPNPVCVRMLPISE